MSNKCIAEFTANGVRFQLLAHDEGRDGYTVFTRVINDWGLDVVDCYVKKEQAVARFIFLTNRILLEVQ